MRGTGYVTNGTNVTQLCPSCVKFSFSSRLSVPRKGTVRSERLTERACSKSRKYEKTKEMNALFSIAIRHRF